MPKLIFNFKLILRAFLTSAKELPPFIKRNVGLILVISLTTEVAHHYFIFMSQISANATSLNLVTKIGALSASLLSLVFYAMLVSLRFHPNDQIRNENFWAFTFRLSRPYILENVRVLGKCLLWLVAGLFIAVILAYLFKIELSELNTQNLNLNPSGSIKAYLLAIIALAPAGFYYLKYTFVPYIVLADPNYEKGTIDALKHSYQLMSGLMIFTLVFFVFISVFDGLRSGFREEYTLLSSPITALIIYLPFELLAIFSNILLFQIYRLKEESLRGV